MRWRHVLVAALLPALLLPAPAARAADLSGTCDVRFEGTSTLHDFSGTARCRPFAVSLVRGADGPLVLAAAEATVPVAEMDTKNETRDRDMRTMFQADRVPAIVARLRDVDVDRLRREAAAGSAGLDMVLRIRDVERPVRAAVTELREEEGRVAFAATFPVSLKEFGLKPPSVLGIIRVKDTVSVRVDVRLSTPSGP